MSDGAPRRRATVNKESPEEDWRVYTLCPGPCGFGDGLDLPETGETAESWAVCSRICLGRVGARICREFGALVGPSLQRQGPQLRV